MPASASASAPAKTATTPDEPHVVADHPALDLLNTGGIAFDGRPVETWHRDADVLRWLTRLGIEPSASSGWRDGELVAAAVQLRETVRAMVTRRKAGKRADPESLNVFLSVPEATRLEWPASGPRLSRQAQGSAVQTVLLPLAQAAAALLVEGDFELVRQCEHPECVLWFYDRTKSHRRRWCSMAICGNRHKVSQFRRRQSA